MRPKSDQLRENFSLLVTKRQINRINKADKTGVDINISKKQISAQSENGGFIGASETFSKNSPSNSSKNSTKSCGPTSNWFIKWVCINRSQ